MEDYDFINNAGEKFTFYLNEANNFCLNIYFKKELIACFNMNDTEMQGIIDWKNKADKYRSETE